ACYHNLPYKAIPRVMIKYLCLNQTANTNIFPAKNGISAYLSPQTIITSLVTDYNKSCQVAFGAYVQAYNETRNDQTPRTFDAIYLRPSKNKQGGHDVMNLQTGKAVNSPRVKEIPLSELVIQAVEKMAVLDLTAEAKTGATTVMTEFYQSMDKAIAEMRQSGAMDREALLATRRKLVAARDEQLKKLFTEEQMSRFLKEVEPTLRPQRQGNAN
ncbi:MAG: hypothetical protein EAZ17_09905, partial [Sphingobacteriales bacterium]